MPRENDAANNGSDGSGTGGNAVGESVASERLARVTYLPGVRPAEPTETTEAGWSAAADASSSAAAGADASAEEAGVAEDAEATATTTAQAQSATAAAAAAVLAEAERAAADRLAEEDAETPGERSARASNVSMHALTRRGMSSAEMVALLRSRDLGEDDVHNEVQRLEGVGLLDDNELADNLVRTLQQRKGLGRSGITAELRRRRVAPEAIERVLDELDGDDELTRARELALKRAPQLRSLDAETARRRLGAFLMRKGYSGSVVSAAVTAALSGSAPTGRGPRFE